MMATFKDLDPLPYFGKPGGSLRAVGWLGGDDYLRGIVSKEFFAALVRLCANPWQPVVMAGRQACPFCRMTGGPSQLSYDGLTVTLGASNVFVPTDTEVFVAPTQIVHYIDAHDYAPPDVFQRAVLECPPMRSVPYLKKVKGHVQGGGSP